MRRFLVPTLLLPSSAFAAEGMPQLDFSNPMTTSQVVWLAIIFAVLYVLLSNWALPQVESVLADRAARIGADLEQARHAQIEAETAQAELVEATRQAQAAAQVQINTASAEAKAKAAELAAITAARLNAQLTEAEQRISAARAAAMGAVRGVAVETATAVITRLTQAPADAHAVQSAVDGILAARAA